MFTTVSPRLPLAIILSACFAPAMALAATPDAPDAPDAPAGDIPTVLVTGSRFANPAALAPIGATVISADEIRRAGATDVNQAIRKVGGVFGRQSLDASPDFSLDLRGFGTNSAQNMVVLLDGVRLSENELSNPVLSTIPIDTVERIEIVRGGSSVLYGDGATGGIIQIITKRANAATDRTSGSASVEVGSLRSYDLRASAARSYQGVAVDAAIDQQATNNDRANSRYHGTSFSGGAQWQLGTGRLALRVDSARQQSRFPGSLTEAQFNADPHQSLTPNDFGSVDSDRVSALLEQRFGGVDFAAELSHREKSVRAHYVADFGFGPSISDSLYNTWQTQFSPRLRLASQYGAIDNELVAGIDLQRWKRATTSSFSLAEARQDAKAVYARDEVRFGGAYNARLSAGVRHEVFDKDYTDALSYPVPANDHTSQSQNAWDLQASVAPVANLTMHAKAGQSYRLATADENSFRPSVSVLQPQTSHDLELGADWRQANVQLGARVFRHRLVNEIYYDPTVPVNGFFGANTNLDPTERRGVEIDGALRFAPGWQATVHAQHLKATFTQGPNSGRELTLVPKNVVTARIGWTSSAGQSADLGAQWVDRQRFGSDFANACDAVIPGHTTFDGRFAQRLGRWELALAGTNLADKRFTSNAFSCRAGIYPSDGRQVKLSARYDF
jgi:iron complex outermembrane receptor protein